MSVLNAGNQTILHIKAGHLAPADMLARLIATKPTAFGFVVQDTSNKDKPELSISREDAKGLTVENLMELQTNAKDFNISLYAGALAAGYDVEDIQPFVLHDANNDPFIAVLLEGDIIAKGDASSAAHTEQYNYVNDMLLPQIVDYCETFDGDISKIMGKINGDLFNKTFMTSVGHRASLHIIPYTGDIITLGKNELGGVYDWGTTSQRHGYGDVSQEPVVEKPKGSRFSFGKKPVTAASTTTVDDKGIHHVGNTKIVDVTKTKSSVPAVAPKEEPKVVDKAPEIAAKPPAWCHTNKDMRAWYLAVSGSIPSNSVLKKRLPCIVKDEAAAKITNLKDFERHVLSKRLVTTGSTGPLNVEQPKTDTAITAPPVEAPITVEEPATLPILSPAQTEQVLDFVAKHLDGNSKEMMDPKEIAALEKDLPTFSASLGLTADEMLNWPVSGVLALAKSNPEAIALMAIEFRNLYRPHAKAKVADTAPKAVTTTTKLTENTTKVESVAPPAPAKGKFSFGRKAA